MSDVQKPDDWTDEQFAAYFGAPDDSTEEPPEIAGIDTVDVPEIEDSGDEET